MKNNFKNKLYEEEIEQVDLVDANDAVEEIVSDDSNNNHNDESVVEVSQVLVATTDTSFEDVRRKNKIKTRKWIVALFFTALILLGLSLFLVWLIKSQFLKPNPISEISKYIKSRDNDILSVDNEKITYSPDKFNHHLKATDLADMLLRSNEDYKDYKFTFYNKETNRVVKRLELDDILDYKNNIYLRVLVDAKSKNPFDLKEGSFKDLPLRIDLSKHLFLFNEQNKLIYNSRKDETLLKVREIMKSGKSFKDAFYTHLHTALKEVYLENGKLNPIYEKMFFEMGRHDFLKESEIETLLIKNTIPNKLYLDNIFEYKFDTIFRFHDELNDRYYEYKASLNEELNFQTLNYIRKKISLLKNNYYLKDSTGHDFISNDGKKALASLEDCYEIVNFILDKNNLNSTYDYGKRVYHPDGKTFVEKVLNKEYKVINSYQNIVRRKAYMLFKTSDNELVDYQKLDTGDISKMPLDLSSIYFNENKKYFDSKTQEFAGWRVLNDGSEITFNNIKKGIFYNFNQDIVLEPIIKNRVNLLVNLPHSDYKPRTESDKNYSLLNFNLSEDDNIYEVLNEFRSQRLTHISEFSNANDFLGMYTDPNYLSKIDKDVKAKDLISNNIVYFKYKITYYKIDFPEYFKKEYSDLIKASNLNIPINEEMDVVSGKLLSQTYLDILHAKNLTTGLSNLLNSYYIEKNDVIFSKFGGVINLLIKEELKTNIKALVYDQNTSDFVFESLAIRKYSRLPKIKDSLRYDDPTRVQTNDGTEKLNYISYPYAVFNGVVYKISAISKTHNFTEILNEEDLINSLKFISFGGEFYYSVFLKIEKIEKEYKYDVSYEGKKIFEKADKSNLYAFDYVGLSIDKELAKNGLKLQTPEDFFPSDYKEKAAEFLHDEKYVVHYVAKKYYFDDLKYLNVRLKYKGDMEESEHVVALPFVFTSDYKDRKYFAEGKNLYTDYDGVKNIIRTIRYLYKKETIDDFDFYEINGFARYLDNNEYKTLIFRNEPTGSYLDYTIRDGMFYEIACYKK